MKSFCASYVTRHRSRAMTHNQTIDRLGSRGSTLCFRSWQADFSGLFGSVLVLTPFEKIRENVILFDGKAAELKVWPR